MMRVSSRDGAVWQRSVEDFEEGARGEDRRLRVDELGEVRVPGDQVVGLDGAGKRDQVVVFGVGRDAGQRWRLGLQFDELGDLRDDLASLALGQVTAEFWAHEDARELAQQHWRRDDHKAALESSAP